ncbi:hypothetical protein C8R43DRAFT_1128495 [Mycena crocata]|nr:hypothetical protein C8R43DRAFT_1128495 [Mycena crocata]
MDEGWRAERKCWESVCVQFHAQVDWRVPDFEEVVLAEFDPNKPLPPREKLSEADEILRRARIEEINDRIRRWYKYRIRRLRKPRFLVGDVTKDPYAVLVAKLSGVHSPPKARQAYQQFMRESMADKIMPAVATRWAEECENNAELRGKSPKAGFRALIARELFDALPKEEQSALGARARSEADSNRKNFMNALRDPPSNAPADRQKCIDGAADFMAPVLRGLQEATGMHALLVLGGPMPRDGGQLRTIHVSYGRNNTAAGLHFAQWDKKRFSENVLGFFTEYLETAFTREQCLDAALPAAVPVNLGDAPYRMTQTPGPSAAHTGDSALDDMDLQKPLDEDSDSESSESSDEDEDEDDEDDDEHEEEPVAKKHKTAASRQHQSSIPRDEEGLTLDERRARNIARNRADLRAIELAHPITPPKRKPVQKRKPKAPPAGAQQLRHKSARHAAVGASTLASADTGEMDLNGEVPDIPTASPVTQSSSSQDATSATVPPTSTGDTANTRTSDTANTRASDTADTRTSDTADTHASDTADTCMSNTSNPAPPAGTMDSAPTWHETSTVDPALTWGIQPPAPAPIVALPADPVLPVIPPASTAPPSSVAPLCPAKAPPWFRDAHASMTEQDLGCHYHAVVAAWTRVEAASKYEHGPQNLANDKRPKQVSSWINGARGKRVCVTEVTNVKAYEKAWNAWWATLQPKWRKKDVDGAWSVIGGYGEDGKEWGPLTRWGINGTLSIVASLYFWGQGVGDDNTHRIAWEAAVLDVAWMLEGLALFYEKFNRRF